VVSPCPEPEKVASLAFVPSYHIEQVTTREVLARVLVMNVGRAPDIVDTLPTQTTGISLVKKMLEASSPEQRDHASYVRARAV
jgi:hypothetical protein